MRIVLLGRCSHRLPQHVGVVFVLLIELFFELVGRSAELRGKKDGWRNQECMFDRR